MEIAPPHPQEEERIQTLESYGILDTEPDLAFDDITAIAAHICRTPIALISLVDIDRQWFKSCVGLDVLQTSRDVAFCSHAILQNQVFEVQDASHDERFQDNPLVAGDPLIRFYAGTPLIADNGLPMGTLCVIDRVPRRLSEDQHAALAALGRQVMAQIELGRSQRTLELTKSELEKSHLELESFAQITAQELRGPAQDIQAKADKIHRDVVSLLRPESVSDLDLIRGSATRLNSLLDGLFAFTRMHELPRFFDSVNLNQAVLRVVSELSLRHGVSPTAFHVGILPEIEAEPNQMEQLLRALLENAVLFAGDRPLDVCIEASLEDVDPSLPRTLGSTVRISVSDQGMGFDPADSERIFRAFERVHGRDALVGTGVGLSICRRIVEHHGGTIWADSPEEHGAAFHVVLPINQEGRRDQIQAA